jgi:hypothetical protein
MNIYELITPSDSITFKTDDDKVAYSCALILGSGKAGCSRRDENNNEVSIPSLLLFDSEPETTIKEYLGETLDEFLDSHKQKIIDCFKSFAYGSIEDRKTYDDALEAITDDEKRKEFQSKHEDRNRTSMSRWVQGAWNIAKKLEEKMLESTEKN